MQSPGILSQLRRERQKYLENLETVCNDPSTVDGPLPLLRDFADSTHAAKALTVFEKKSSRCLILVQSDTSDGSEVEEVVMRVQGYNLQGKLPPIREHHIPHNRNRLISLQESITLAGLGSQSFDLAVQAANGIHQRFAKHVGDLRGNLRGWSPGDFDDSFTITFANRYLSSARDAVGEKAIDLSKTVDPYNVLRPLLFDRSEVHVAENVVEHWERCKVPVTGQDQSSAKFVRIKPDIVNVGQMLELQVSFVVVKVGRDEFCMLPKLRAVCILDRAVEMDYNLALLKVVHTKNQSPLKRTKRRVGYGQQEPDSSGSEGSPVPEMKRMCIDRG